MTLSSSKRRWTADSRALERRRVLTVHGAQRRRRAVVRPNGVSRKLAYAAALIGVVVDRRARGTGIGFGELSRHARAANLQRLFETAGALDPSRGPSYDRQAQARMPFSIVVPTGLPAGTHLRYAAVTEHPAPRVVLAYEARIAGKYYPVNVAESTGDVGPPEAHVEVRVAGHGTRRFEIPVRRWMHGAIVMDLTAPGLPAAMSDRIVRANTK